MATLGAMSEGEGAPERVPEASVAASQPGPGAHPSGPKGASLRVIRSSGSIRGLPRAACP